MYAHKQRCSSSYIEGRSKKYTSTQPSLIFIHTHTYTCMSCIFLYHHNPLGSTTTRQCLRVRVRLLACVRVVRKKGMRCYCSKIQKTFHSFADYLLAAAVVVIVIVIVSTSSIYGHDALKFDYEKDALVVCWICLKFEINSHAHTTYSVQHVYSFAFTIPCLSFLSICICVL